MKYAVLALALLTGCAAPLSEITHDPTAQVDVGARKLRASISVIRSGLQMYAQTAVELCGVAPVDADACASIDSVASDIVRKLDTATAALDLYEAGKGEFDDAYQAVVEALVSAKDYAAKVMELAARARA